MKLMKTPDFKDRLSAAGAAKKAQLERVRAIAEDPERLDRRSSQPETAGSPNERGADVRRESVKSQSGPESEETPGTLEQPPLTIICHRVVRCHPGAFNGAFHGCIGAGSV
jgi:hypothetical protein